MSARDIVIAMLPEHLLLAGLVALLVLEIASARPRGALPLSLLALVGALSAAAILAIGG